jgi:hypothetical protein
MSIAYKISNRNKIPRLEIRSGWLKAELVLFPSDVAEIRRKLKPYDVPITQ